MIYFIDFVINVRNRTENNADILLSATFERYFRVIKFAIINNKL